MTKKLSPSAQKLEDKLMRLSKTTKVRPKQVNNSDVFQFHQEEVIKRTDKPFNDAPKSDNEMGMEGCLVGLNQDGDDYQGDGTEWIYEQDENGTIYRRKMGSDISEKVR
tara:strand:- start:63 stop:389 length:327 start_codon:yes stop_codon:yes gene_type:complete